MRRSSSSAIPPAARTGRPASRTSVRSVEVRPGERAVAARARHEQPRDAGFRAPSGELAGRDVGRRQPAVRDHAAVACVDCDDDPLVGEAGRGPTTAAVPTITLSAPRRAPPESPLVCGSRRRPGSSGPRRARLRAIRVSVGPRTRRRGRRRAATRRPRPRTGQRPLAGSPPSIVTRSRRPSNSRTQRPSRTSIAGMTSKLPCQSY